ncbi:MAG: hypothetical protein IKL89_03700 [Clostridia bacterium]|nr:hypothetical protein [Clostridia bacterium]
MRKRTHRWIFVLLIFALLFLSGCAPRLPEGENPWRDAVKAYYADPGLYTSLERRLSEEEHYDEKLGARDVIREFVPLKETPAEEYGFDETMSPEEIAKLVPQDLDSRVTFFRQYYRKETQYIGDVTMCYYNVRGVITCDGVKAYEYQLFWDRRTGDDDDIPRGLDWNKSLVFYSAKKLKLSDFKNIEIGDTIDDVAAIDPVTPQYMAYCTLQYEANNGLHTYPMRFYSIHLTEQGFHVIWYIQRTPEERPIVSHFMGHDTADVRSQYLAVVFNIGQVDETRKIDIPDRDKIYK